MAIVKKAIAEEDFKLNDKQKSIPMVLVIEETENVVK